MEVFSIINNFITDLGSPFETFVVHMLLLKNLQFLHFTFVSLSAEILKLDLFFCSFLKEQKNGYHIISVKGFILSI